MSPQTPSFSIHLPALHFGEADAGVVERHPSAETITTVNAAMIDTLSDVRKPIVRPNRADVDYLTAVLD